MLACGCGDTIALGSECPPFGEECIERTPRQRQPEPNDAASGGSPAVDAGSVEMPDGQVALLSDGGGIGPGSFPAFENPSLEITAGSLAGGLISSFTALVSPWLSCSPPGFGPGAYPRADLRANFPVGSPAANEVLAPTNGMSLVNASPDGTSIAQTLQEPLLAGKPYAFVVDLAATQNSTDLVLDVQGSSGCFAPQTLATTPAVTAGTWSSVCVRFVPDRDYSSIMLAASSASAATGTRIFIDNIRADASCQ